MRAKVQEKLARVEREQVIKEILAEHQLYSYSTKRFLTDKTTEIVRPPYGGPITLAQQARQDRSREVKLISQEALEAMRIAKQLNLAKKVNIPSLTFLIHNLVLFTFQGVQLMIITFENRKVKLFEVETGHFQSEFLFVDSSLDTYTNTRARSEHSSDSGREQPRESSGQFAPDGEPRPSSAVRSPAARESDDILTKMIKGTRKSAFGKVPSKGRGMPPLEKAFVRRKELRDRGLYRPEPVKMMEIEKAANKKHKGLAKSMLVDFTSVVKKRETKAAGMQLLRKSTAVAASIERQMQLSSDDSAEKHDVQKAKYAASRFSSVVKLNQDDDIPLGLMDDLWEAVENPKGYSNPHLATGMADRLRNQRASRVLSKSMATEEAEKALGAAKKYTDRYDIWKKRQPRQLSMVQDFPNYLPEFEAGVLKHPSRKT